LPVIKYKGFRNKKFRATGNRYGRTINKEASKIKKIMKSE